MKLSDLFRHNVRITCTNGLVIEGYVDVHISAENNYPDPESIMIQNYEVFVEDIKDASIID